MKIYMIHIYTSKFGEISEVMEKGKRRLRVGYYKMYMYSKKHKR